MSKSQSGKTFEALQGVIRALPKIGGMQGVLDAMLSHLAESLSAGKALALVCQGGIDKFVIAASLGMDQDQADTLAQSLEHSASSIQAIAPEPFALFQTRPQVRPLSHLAESDRPAVRFIGAPVTVQGRFAGLILADRIFENSRSLQEDAAFLELVADLAGGLIGAQTAEHAAAARLARINAALRADLSRHSRDFTMIGESRAMQDIRWQAESVAPSGAPVLITGEPGTGKSRLARVIHHLSDRADNPLIFVDCAGPDSKTLDARIFGQSPPGAGPVPGRMEAAEGGALCLRDVDSLPPDLQVKVLHFLRTREVVRADGSRFTADVRLFACSRIDMDKAAQDNEFNADLYYRLSVLLIHIPPLRQRPEDIPALANHFAAAAAGRTGRRLTLEPEALSLMSAHPWPGNADDVRDVIERLAATAPNERAGRQEVAPLLSDAPRRNETHRPGAPQPTLKDIERNQVLAALKRNAWVQRRAAEELDLTQRQIGYKIRKHGLEDIVARERARARGR